MSARQPSSPDLAGVMEQMRRLAVASGDAKLMGGIVQPDEELLALCAEALELIKDYRRKEEISCNTPFDWDAPDEVRSRPYKTAREAHDRAKQILRRAGRIKATTAPGIFAKATLVRTSASGAAILAKSMANDLLSNTALRAGLWPVVMEAEGE